MAFVKGKKKRERGREGDKIGGKRVYTDLCIATGLH